jgi:AcrR family transcriptional regulator
MTKQVNDRQARGAPMTGAAHDPPPDRALMTGSPHDLLVELAQQPPPSDGRRARGMRSRAAVLERSVQLASRDGLEGLTIGALAADLGAHKSSVHALFGSKEELQLATLAAARTILIDRVIRPALSASVGLPRLQAIGEAWCDYLAADVFAGGCFLCAASAEMDGRPGPLRDAVESVMREWIAVLSANVEAAIAAHELRAGQDPAAIAFRLNALGMAANWQRQLLNEPSGIEHARVSWRAELDRLA